MNCKRCNNDGVIAVGNAAQFCKCPIGREWKAVVKELRDDLRAEIAGERPWRNAAGQPIPRPATAGDPAKILELMGPFLPDEGDHVHRNKI